jgi:hypothetical protein
MFVSTGVAVSVADVEGSTIGVGEDACVGEATAEAVGESVGVDVGCWVSLVVTAISMVLVMVRSLMAVMVTV